MGHFVHEPDLSKWDQVFQYEVVGLPPFEQAWIANFGSPYREEWRILRATKGAQSDWSGNYGSAETALVGLRKDLIRVCDTSKRIKEPVLSPPTRDKEFRSAMTCLCTSRRFPLEPWMPPTQRPGLKEIRGRITPYVSLEKNELTLQMQDGRNLLFFFKDMQGSIALNRWIG